MSSRLFHISYVFACFQARTNIYDWKAFFYLQKKNGNNHDALTCSGNLDATWCLDHHLLKQQQAHTKEQRLGQTVT